jgi:hypothetical protein
MRKKRRRKNEKEIKKNIYVWEKDKMWVCVKMK